MVQAWFMDTDIESDQRFEHHQNPPKYIDLEDLKKTTGVEYFKVSIFFIKVDYLGRIEL